MKTVVALLAGGSGKRLGADVPKQFLIVEGKMIIDYTISIFQNHPQVDEIVIVCHADFVDFLKGHLLSVNFHKVVKVLPGGVERYHSSLVALDAFDDGEDKKILFHDAVRPLVTNEIISGAIDKLDYTQAVGVGIVTTDTIWSVTDGIINAIPDRNTMFRAQTPQGFMFSTIKEAYSLALKDSMFKVTDDCGVVNTYLPHVDIHLVEGSDTNIKITRNEDLIVMEKVIKERQL